MNAVQGLKVLAAVMGVLIIAAIGLLGYGVYSKLDGDGKAAPVSGTGPQAPVADLPASGVRAVVAPGIDTLAPLSLDQPSGSRIVGASTAGDFLTLRVEGGDRPDRVAVVDLRTGRVAAWVHVGPLPGE